MTKQPHAYLPAAGKDLFLPLYDPLTALMGIGRVRRSLLAQAELSPGTRLLDVGCGTGSLLALIGKTVPNVRSTGLDPDPKALARAARKLEGMSVQLDRGFADQLPYAEATFDRVFSSFMFHHLEAAQQQAMLSEACRVLKAGGRLELVDFAGSDHRGPFKWLHAHGRLEGNAQRNVLDLMSRAGFVARTVRVEKGLFSLVYYQAMRH
jgi:ubiquinone/menaquinone biosynthesis C-methylase UbiE